MIRRFRMTASTCLTAPDFPAQRVGIGVTGAFILMTAATTGLADPGPTNRLDGVRAEDGVDRVEQLAQTSVCSTNSSSGTSCIDVPFPDDGTTPPEPDGVPPQVRSPSLTTPDLLITDPHAVPDLEGRFSNGGNEEIW